MRRWLFIPLALLLFFLNGCERETFESTEPVKLKVVYTNESLFEQEYGQIIALKFPHIEVEVIPTENLNRQGDPSIEQLEELLEKNQPDIIFPSIYYEALAKGGKLYDLTPLIERDGFDLQRIQPAVVEVLKVDDKGIYALASYFSPSVLMFNKDLFDRHRVDYPLNGMTWEETLQLAGRFPREQDGERLYGFYQMLMEYPSSYVSFLADYYELDLVDGEGKRVTMNTDNWSHIFRLVLQAYVNGVLKEPEPERMEQFKNSFVDVQQIDMFSAGRAAMTIAGYDQIHHMNRFGSSFEWDMVQVPAADPRRPISPHLDVYHKISIYAHAAHADAAWEVIRYLNGPEAAEANSRTVGRLSVYPEFAPQLDGKDMTMFYDIQPSVVKTRSFHPALGEFYPLFSQLVDKEIEKMRTGEQSIEEGLTRIQKEGQELLDYAWRVQEGQESEAGAGNT